MKKVNALKIRTKFGMVLEELKREGKPILVSRGQKVEAALVPIDLFNERFVDRLGQEALEQMIRDLDALQGKPKGSRLSQIDLRHLRGELG